MAQCRTASPTYHEPETPIVRAFSDLDPADQVEQLCEQNASKELATMYLDAVAELHLLRALLRKANSERKARDVEQASLRG